MGFGSSLRRLAGGVPGAVSRSDSAKNFLGLGRGPGYTDPQALIGQQDRLSRYNIESPFGSRTFSTGPDGRSVLNIQETDSQRGIRESQEGLAQSLYRSRAPSIDDFEGIAQGVTDQIYNRGMERLDPLQQRNMRRREIELANRGLGLGGEAYRTSIRDLNQTQQDARQTLLSNAILSGINQAKDLTRLGEDQRSRRFAETGTATGGINAQLFGNVAGIDSSGITRGVEENRRRNWEEVNQRRTAALSGLLRGGMAALSGGMG